MAQNVIRPQHSLPVMNFMDREHHFVVQSATVMGSIDFTKNKADAISKHAIPVTVFEVSHFMPSEDNVEMYGQEIERTASSYIVICNPDEDIRTIMPEPGQPVSITFDNIPKPYPFPDFEQTHHMAERRSKRLEVKLLAAAYGARNEKRRLDKQKAKRFSNTDDDGYSDSDDTETDTVYEALVEGALDMFADCLPAGDDDEEQARRWVSELAGREGQDIDEWRQAIQKFVDEHPPLREVIKPELEKIKFNGFAMNPPKGCPTAARLFYVNGPKQPYPDFFKAPLYRFDWNIQKLEGSLRSNLKNLDRLKPTCDCMIFVDPNPKSLEMEGKGVASAHKEPKLKAYMEYIARFEDIDGLDRNLYQELELNILYDKLIGDDPKTAKSLLKFNKAPDGKMMITGCPGAGKTRLARLVALHLIERSIEKASNPESASPNVPQIKWENPAFKNKIVPSKAAKGTLKGLVVWMDPQNEQADDFMLKVKGMQVSGRNVKALRVYPIDQEKRALLKTEPPTELHWDRSSNAALAHLVEHAKGELVNRKAVRNPETDENSLAKQAMARANQNTAKYADFLDHRNNDDIGRKELGNDGILNMQDLIADTIKEFDIIVGTPFAIISVANYIGGIKPNLVVIDEAARHSEAMTCAIFAKFVGVPTLMPGDPRQPGPVSSMAMYSRNRQSAAETHFRCFDTFGYQQATSLMHRADTNGKIQLILEDNYRAHGDTATYAETYLYHGMMNVVNQHDTEPWTFVHENVIKKIAPEAATNMIFINLPDADEKKVGFSFINELAADFTAATAVQILATTGAYSTHDKSQPATVLVASPYNAEISCLQRSFSRYPQSIYPSKNVDIRTVDTTASHEADIVIIPLTRSDKMGFITEPHRMSIMFTRARLATILVGNEKACLANGSLSPMMEWCKERKAVIEIQGWHAFCTRCLQHGHRKTECKTSFICQNCGHAHAMHRCYRLKNIRGTIQAGAYYIDGVERDAWKSIGNTAGHDDNQYQDSATQDWCQGTQAWDNTAGHVDSQRQDSHTVQDDDDTGEEALRCTGTQWKNSKRRRTLAGNGEMEIECD